MMSKSINRIGIPHAIANELCNILDISIPHEYPDVCYFF